MTKCKAPWSANHDGPEWFRISRLNLVARGNHGHRMGGRKPKPCVLHFEDHDEPFVSLRAAGEEYGWVFDTIVNAARRKGRLPTENGFCTVELIGKKGEK